MLRLQLVFIASGLLCCLVEVEAHSHVIANLSDETAAGCEQFVTYHTGSSDGWPPVVLSAPHGGRLRPPGIPDRDAGCWVTTEDRCEYTHSCGEKNFTRCRAITDGDLYTYELTLQIRRNLCVLFGGNCPAAVYNNLSRAKFDANRNISDATYNVPEVLCAFLKYKSHIDDAKSVTIGNQSNQAGLFIDIHGHGHRIQRAELGYLIRGSDLDSREPLRADRTSIRSLAARRAAKEFDSLLRGNSSFGALLERYGFSAVPSPTNRGPGTGNPYFNGGYLTRVHGSLNGGTIDAIQIESARSFREPSTRGRYARAIACALRDFVCMYYSQNRTDIVSGCTDEHLQGYCSGQPCILNTCFLWIAVVLTLMVCHD